MNPIVGLAIAVAFLAVAFGVFMYVQKRRTLHLRSKFGPEYDRLVDRYGNQRKAEDDLSHRERRLEKLQIRDLDSDEADRFANACPAEQSRFFYNPNQP